MTDVLGSGNYGCVFSISDDEVIKVFFEQPPWAKTYEEGKEFARVQKAILAIDPENKYFVPTKKTIKLNLEDYPTITECWKQYLNRMDSTFKPLEKKFFVGEIQTRAVPTNPRTWDDAQWQHVLDGLNLLHSNNFIHGDISEENFGLRNGMPVFIDMDFAASADNTLVYDTSRPKYLALKKTLFDDIKSFEYVLEKCRTD